MRSIVRSRDRQYLFLFWLAPAIVGAYGLHVVNVKYNPDLTFVEKLGSQVLIWCAWGVWSQLIFSACDRFPFTRAGWWKTLLVLLPLSVAVVAGQIWVLNAASVWYGLSPGWPWASAFRLGVREYGDIFFTVYWGIVGAHAAFKWHEGWLTERVRAAQLQRDLADAQLRALKAQLNPHFLFNALNSVVTLIRRDPAAAERVVVDLGDLLRSTLALSSETEIPLRDEVALVSRYLEIEQVRFSDRLGVKWSVDDAARDLLVPALVLQPLVENAIVHGTSRNKGSGTITIGAHRDNGTLMLTVRDDGPGPSGSGTRGNGIGTANLRERLARLYADEAALTLRTNGGGVGCVATVTLPARTATSGSFDAPQFAAN